MGKNEKLAIYNQLRMVPEEAQKQFNSGRFNGTDINPMWRIEKLTETFGACGTGWYFSRPDFAVECDGNVKTIHCTVALYININGEWSQPIWGVGGNTLASVNKDGRLVVCDDGYKMAYTDAQSNATKLLGLGADVWFSKSKTKYSLNHHPQEGAILQHLETATGMDDLNKTLADFGMTKEELKNYPSLRNEFNRVALSF